MWVRNIIMRVFMIFLVFIGCSEQRSTPQDDHYVAAVVEYAVSRDVEYNRLKYTELIAEAAQQNADIVVFPELTLTNATVSFSVPLHGLLKEYPIPALHPDLYDELLVSMSEAARQHQIYLLFNGQEAVDCTNTNSGEECPEAKQYFFNTNVVIDRNGAVIDRYRKINLFGEYSRTPALRPDLGIFHTDFGVTFGHFICFDLMFQVPAIQTVQKHQLTDIIFSTMWFSEMPYLTAVQIQESYAYALNVNFLASGANRPEVGSAGSGIYSGKAGALVSIMPGVSTTRLLIAKVPKVPGQVTEPVPGPIYDNPSDHDGLHLISDPSLTAHVSRLLVDGPQEFVLVDKDVSCTFRVKLTHASGTQQYKYRAAAFSGVRSFSGVETGGSRVCSVVACIGETMDTCGRRFDTYAANATATFEELVILATFPTPLVDADLDADNSAIFPVALKSSIMPLEPDAYSYDVITEGRLTYFNFTLNDFDEELYTFAVWGRVFATDGQEADPPIQEPGTDSSYTTLAVTESVPTTTPGAAHSHLLSGVLLVPALVLVLKGNNDFM